MARCQYFHKENVDGFNHFKLNNFKLNSNFKFQISNSRTGFTLFEIVIVISILSILAAVSIASFTVMQKRSDVEIAAQEFAGILKLAQNKTLSSENDSVYGVFINTAASPHQYTLFRGATYATRDSAFDQITA